MLRSFRDLTVWQKSMQLATSIYKLTQGFPREETYGLASQLRRAAVSIPSNIAEGHGRSGVGEYRHFLWIARGSNFELQTHCTVTQNGRREIAQRIRVAFAGDWQDAVPTPRQIAAKG
jgi:four helix bundle protein